LKEYRLENQMPLKYIPSKQIDNRRVRRLASSESRRRFAIVFLLGLSLVIGMIFSGWVRWKQTEIVFRINRAESVKSTLVEQQKLMLVELNGLKSFNATFEAALERLGMIPVDPADVTRVELPAPAPDEDISGTSTNNPAGGESR
jgi:hypothetical protein